MNPLSLKWSPKAAIGLAAALIVATATTGIAYTFWSTGGSGSGTARAATAQALTTVDATATTAATLYPGANGSLTVKIDNPNVYPVRVTGVAGNGAVTVDAGHATCTNAGIVFTDQTGLTIDVAAGSATEATLAGSVSMATTAGDACQGAVFTIPVTLTGIQTAGS